MTLHKGEIRTVSSDDPSFEEMYRETTPPWEIGRPQREVVGLAEAGLIRGRVLDVGCGTGENALYLAGHGLEVCGVDAAATAITRAREKAQERGLSARFDVADALHLETLSQSFDTVIDCGLFHTFSNEDRGRYVRSLASVVEPDGLVCLLCFSENEPGDWGPRRITQGEIRETFRDGWAVEEIRPAAFETRFEEGDVQAWLVLIRRAA